MRSMLKYAAFGVVVMLIGAAGAGAGSLISGTRIKKGTIPENRLNRTVRHKLALRSSGGGQVGAQGGQQGPKGDKGDPGSGGTVSFAGPHWGLIDRNTIGSPVGALRSGPFEGSSAPPFGQGSLGLSVKDNTEKVAFGNEVDFNGNPVSGVNAVGFRVFTTGENKALFADNLPNITFEVDPTGPSSSTAPNYSSLVFVPTGTGVPTNQWSPYIDATNASTGGWYFTNGTTASTTGCTQASMCSFTAMKAAVATSYPSMSILTFAVSKGRDYAWNGAADGLRLNNQVFDFEPFGVLTRSP